MAVALTSEDGGAGAAGGTAGGGHGALGGRRRAPPCARGRARGTLAVEGSTARIPLLLEVVLSG